jgi:uncharacterized protein YkwD
MATRLLTAAFLLSTLLHTTEGVCQDTSKLTAEEKAVLDAHNALRAKHTDTDPLCYGVSGNDVTFSSQSWSNKLAADKSFDHSKGSYGENLAMAGTSGTVPAKSPAYVASTNAWYDEIKDWDYSTNAKSASAPGNAMTGHFTQVVWRNSKQVNCGYATYKDGNFNKYVVTCQYYPPGNFNNAYAANVGPVKSASGKTCNKPTVTNAALQPTTATVKEGEKYTVTCTEGFIIVGLVNTLTCGSDGKFTPASITCTAAAKTCSKPTVANATLEPTTATVKEGEKFTVKCSKGFKLKGDVSTFTCGKDGKVDPATITCESGVGKITFSALLWVLIAIFRHRSRSPTLSADMSLPVRGQV